MSFSSDCLLFQWLHRFEGVKTGKCYGLLCCVSVDFNVSWAQFLQVVSGFGVTTVIAK